MNSDLEKVWMKIHKLECQINYFLDERNSKPETVNAKHAWDMILMHISRELKDAKQMLREVKESKES